MCKKCLRYKVKWIITTNVEWYNYNNSTQSDYAIWSHCSVMLIKFLMYLLGRHMHSLKTWQRPCTCTSESFPHTQIWHCLVIREIIHYSYKKHEHTLNSMQNPAIHTFLIMSVCLHYERIWILISFERHTARSALTRMFWGIFETTIFWRILIVANKI